jgi:GTP-binding protein HflX
VESFRATLDEVREADIILHVRDISSSHTETEAADVVTVLEELGLGPDSGRRLIEVWNKVDLLDASARQDLGVSARRIGALPLSAVSGEGIDDLLRRLAELVDDGPEITFHLAAADGEALAWLYRHGRVVGRSEDAGGTRVRARLDPQALGRFQRMRPQAELPAAAE